MFRFEIKMIYFMNFLSGTLFFTVFDVFLSLKKNMNKNGINGTCFYAEVSLTVRPTKHIYVKRKRNLRRIRKPIIIHQRNFMSPKT